MFTNLQCRKTVKKFSMGMEDETRAFLVRIVQTISMVMLWMLVNVYIGIYKGCAFFEVRPDWTNWLYYLFFLTSLAGLVIYLMRKWEL
jgi:hypothetical protein